ncbi:MAG: hypothetical protein ACLUZX_12130 [Subdoligranulum sp.]
MKSTSVYLFRMFGKGDFYILRAKGDSMVDAGIEEDDLLCD